MSSFSTRPTFSRHDPRRPYVVNNNNNFIFVGCQHEPRLGTVDDYRRRCSSGGDLRGLASRRQGRKESSPAAVDHHDDAHTDRARSILLHF